MNSVSGCNCPPKPHPCELKSCGANTDCRYDSTKPDYICVCRGGYYGIQNGEITNVVNEGIGCQPASQGDPDNEGMFSHLVIYLICVISNKKIFVTIYEP